MSNSSAGSPSSGAATRRLPLRIGLVLATLLAVLGIVPVIAIGFDGSEWDPIILAFLILVIVVALGTLILLPFAWRGRRGAAVGVIVLQALSVIPALPAFFLPADETPEGGVALAVGGILAAVVAIVLIAVGARGKA
jgi:hypothetical protein